VPVPSPAYHRAQAKVSPALQVDALTLVSRLHLLALCWLAVRLARRRCPPPLPAGPGGRPHVYREESLLLSASVHLDRQFTVRKDEETALSTGYPPTRVTTPMAAPRLLVARIRLARRLMETGGDFPKEP
jgi:hypothetical protein